MPRNQDINAQNVFNTPFVFPSARANRPAGPGQSPLAAIGEVAVEYSGLLARQDQRAKKLEQQTQADNVLLDLQTTLQQQDIEARQTDIASPQEWYNAQRENRTRLIEEYSTQFQDPEIFNGFRQRATAIAEQLNRSDLNFSTEIQVARGVSAERDRFNQDKLSLLNDPSAENAALIRNNSEENFTRLAELLGPGAEDAMRVQASDLAQSHILALANNIETFEDYDRIIETIDNGSFLFADVLDPDITFKLKQGLISKKEGQIAAFNKQQAQEFSAFAGDDVDSVILTGQGIFDDEQLEALTINPELTPAQRKQVRQSLVVRQQRPLIQNAMSRIDQMYSEQEAINFIDANFTPQEGQRGGADIGVQQDIAAALKTAARRRFARINDDPAAYMSPQQQLLFELHNGSAPFTSSRLNRQQRIPLLEEAAKLVSPTGQLDYNGLKPLQERIQGLVGPGWYNEFRSTVKDLKLPEQDMNKLNVLMAFAGSPNFDRLVQLQNFDVTNGIRQTGLKTEQLQRELTRNSRLSSYLKNLQKLPGFSDFKSTAAIHDLVKRQAVSLIADGTYENKGAGIQKAVKDAIELVIPGDVVSYGGGKQLFVPKGVNPDTLRRHIDQTTTRMRNNAGNLYIRASQTTQRPIGEIRLDSSMSFSQRKQVAKPWIQYASTQTGVPADLISSLLEQESAFVHTRQGKLLGSNAGAAGVAQFIQGTAKGMKVDRNSASSSILGAARLLKKNFESTGSWDLAVAAYHGGLGAIQNGRINPKWKEKGPNGKRTVDYSNEVIGRWKSGKYRDMLVHEMDVRNLRQDVQNNVVYLPSPGGDFTKLNAYIPVRGADGRELLQPILSRNSGKSFGIDINTLRDVSTAPQTEALSGTVINEPPGERVRRSQGTRNATGGF